MNRLRALFEWLRQPVTPRGYLVLWVLLAALAVAFSLRRAPIPDRRPPPRPPPPAEPTDDAPDLAFANVEPGSPEGALALARRILTWTLDDATEQTGVHIRYIDHEEELEADRGLLPAEASRLPMAVEAIVDALLVYPEPIRTGALQQVRIFDTLWDGEANWAGFANCGRRDLRVALLEKRSGHSLQTTIHHELAHLLSCRDDFDREGWRRLSQRHLPGSPKDVVAGKAPALTREDIHRRGFVNRYAGSSEAEDFAETWELWMTAPERLERLADQHPQIARKRDFLLRQWDTWRQAEATP